MLRFSVTWLIFVALVLASAVAGGEESAPGTVRFSEQTIYVPYDQLEEIFEKEGRGVFLPYKRFLDLWTQLTPALDRPPEVKPPVDGVLVAAEYRGRVEGHVALLEAHLEFRALGKGYTTVPLGTEQLAISEVRMVRSDRAGEVDYATEEAFLATVDGKTAAILPGPGRYHFALQLMLPVTETPGRKTLRWQPPMTSVSRFQMDLSEEGLAFELKPAAAYTAEDLPGGGTRLSAFFDASRAMEISWSPRREEHAAGALFFADTRGKVEVSEGSLRTEFTLDLSVLLSGLQELDLQLPADAQVLSVETPNLRSWDTTANGSIQTVHVALHTPAEGSLRITLACEVLAATPEGIRETPQLVVPGARRQSGHLEIFAPDSLELRTVTAEGVSQEAVAPPPGGPRPLMAFRYLRTPYRLAIEVTRTRPRVEVETHTLVQVGLDRWVVLSRIDYNVKKAGVFSLEVALPQGWGEPDLVDAEALVEDTRLSPGTPPVLEVQLKNRMSGKFSLLLRSERPWQSPEGETEATATLPLMTPLGAERVEGYLGLAAHESLRVNTADLGGTRAEDVGGLGALPAADPGLAASPSLGFRYRDEAAPPQVSLMRRKPRVSAEVHTLAEIHEAFLKLSTRLLYRVEYAGVDEFSFQLPTAIADEVHITGNAIKERTKVVTGATTTWTIHLQSKQLGLYALSVDYETTYQKAAAGAVETSSAEVSVPRIAPLDVFRLVGYVAVARDGNLEVTPRVTGLEAIDNKELPGGLQGPSVFLAYKYESGTEAERKAWQADFTVLRHAYVEVPASLVNLAELSTVLSREGFQTTEVIYYVQNKRAQYLELDLPEGARILSDIYVDQVAEQPSRRESDGKLLVRLRGTDDPNRRIPVRLVYEIAPEESGLGWWGKARLQPPLLAGTTVLQTWWTLYLPEGYDYPRFDGPMQERATTTAGWRRWRTVIDWAIPRFGFAAPGSPAVQQQAGAREEVGAAAGLNVKLVEEGLRFRLRRLAEPAPVIVSYRKSALSLCMEIVAFVLAIWLGLVFVDRKVVGRLGYVVGAGLVAVFLSVLVAPRAVGVYQWFYAGVLVLGVVWGAKALATAWANRPVRPAPVPAAPAPPPPPPAPAKPNATPEVSDDAQA